MLWSLWGLFYFNNLAQPWSVIGSFGTGAAGACYSFLVFYYVRLERSGKPENKKVMVLGSLATMAVNRLLGIWLVVAGSAYAGRHWWTDMLNSGFEWATAVFVFRNCLALVRDKEYKGASFLGVVFYTSWGAWNVFYYLYLRQYWSWAAGLLIFVTNIAYVSLILRYKFGVKLSLKKLLKRLKPNAPAIVS